jgi:hypothetical protein
VNIISCLRPVNEGFICADPVLWTLLIIIHVRIVKIISNFKLLLDMTEFQIHLKSFFLWLKCVHVVLSHSFFSFRLTANFLLSSLLLVIVEYHWFCHLFKVLHVKLIFLLIF